MGTVDVATQSRLLIGVVHAPKFGEGLPVESGECYGVELIRLMAR